MDSNTKLALSGLTVIVGETVVAATHGGFVGIAVAAAAGVAAYHIVSDVEKVSGREIPSLPVPKLGNHDHDKPSLAYRIFNGKSTRRDETNEDETLALGELIFPHYKDDETLRLGQAIEKDALAILTAAYQKDPTKRLPQVPGRRFEPHIDGLFGKSMIIAAVPGSGKSMLIGLFVEQAGECDAPAIVLDHKGEYTGITELKHLSGLIAGGESARRKALTLGVPYFALTPKNADTFVEKVITEHLQAIVMLPSYGEKWLGKAEIVAEVGHALMRYSARQIEAGEEVLPCLVMLDEAQLYLPERTELLPPEARRNGEVLESLFNAFFTLATAGRSNGYTIGFATQSLTYIGKWVIKGCQIKVLMRHAEHNDLEMIGKIVGKVASRDEMESMPASVGVVVGLTHKPMVVQFDTKQSRDASSTPGIARLREARAETPTVSQPTKVGDLTLPELVAVLTQKIRPIESYEEPNTDGLEEDGDDSYEEKEQKPENVTPMPVPIVQDKGRRAEDIDPKIAIEIWNAGYNSKRKLMSVFGITDHQALRLMEIIGVKEKA